MSTSFPFLLFKCFLVAIEDMLFICFDAYAFKVCTPPSKWYYHSPEGQTEANSTERNGWATALPPHATRQTQPTTFGLSLHIADTLRE